MTQPGPGELPRQSLCDNWHWVNAAETEAAPGALGGGERAVDFRGADTDMTARITGRAAN